MEMQWFRRRACVVGMGLAWAAVSACSGSADYETARGSNSSGSGGWTSTGGSTGGWGNEPPAPPRPGPSQADAGAPPPSACDGLPTDPVTLYQSADDSNSTASATMARQLIMADRHVPAQVIRGYEFVNYY